MSTDKLKIGVIGCSGIAYQKHLPGLKANSDLCEIIAFCDIDIKKAQKASIDYGCSDSYIYDDYKKLLSNKIIDIVHILTPNAFHCPMTIDSFLAGKHVMCEKPMARTSKEAQMMLDAWRISGKQFTISYQNRFRKEVQLLHKSCREGLLGDIYFAKATAIRRRGVPTWGAFLSKSLQGGGPLIDIGTHALDLTLWLMDNYQVESVNGSAFYKLGKTAEAMQGNIYGNWDTEKYEVEDSAFGFIKMKNGATIIIESSWALNISKSCEASTTLCGTKAGAELRPGEGINFAELHYNSCKDGFLINESISIGGQTSSVDDYMAELGGIEMKQWLSAILKGEKPVVDPAQAFQVTKILEAIYVSSIENREVKF